MLYHHAKSLLQIGIVVLVFWLPSSFIATVSKFYNLFYVFVAFFKFLALIEFSKYIGVIGDGKRVNSNISQERRLKGQ